MAKNKATTSNKKVLKKKQSEETISENGKLNPQIVVAVIGGLVTIIIALFSFPPFIRLFEPKESPTPTPVNTTDVQSTAEPTITESSALTATTVPSVETNDLGADMVLIPAGEFIMGSDNGDANETPAHVVYLDSYYIDKTEVTNAAYKLCVRDGVCQSPIQITSRTRAQYYGNAQFDNYPVLYIDWGMARTYCDWRGARLPTEAEWEKAARGENSFIYSWGDEFACHKGNFDDENQIDDYVVPGGPNCDGYPDTAPVHSYPAGASSYGVLDMNGNVWEWVNSQAQAFPYIADDGRESPNSDSLRVVKGGAFTANDYFSRSSNRRFLSPVTADDVTGFRCAMDGIK
jgi:serine/threonine-protein kinase